MTTKDRSPLPDNAPAAGTVSAPEITVNTIEMYARIVFTFVWATTHDIAAWRYVFRVWPVSGGYSDSDTGRERERVLRRYASVQDDGVREGSDRWNMETHVERFTQPYYAPDAPVEERKAPRWERSGEPLNGDHGRWQKLYARSKREALALGREHLLRAATQMTPEVQIAARRDAALAEFTECLRGCKRLATEVLADLDGETDYRFRATRTEYIAETLSDVLKSHERLVQLQDLIDRLGFEIKREE